MAATGGGVSSEAGAAIPTWQRRAHDHHNSIWGSAQEAAAPAQDARQQVPAGEARERNRRVVKQTAQERAQKSTPHTLNECPGRLAEAEDSMKWRRSCRIF